MSNHSINGMEKYLTILQYIVIYLFYNFVDPIYKTILKYVSVI